MLFWSLPRAFGDPIIDAAPAVWLRPPGEALQGSFRWFAAPSTGQRWVFLLLPCLFSTSFLNILLYVPALPLWAQIRASSAWVMCTSASQRSCAMLLLLYHLPFQRPFLSSLRFRRWWMESFLPQSPLLWGGGLVKWSCFLGFLEILRSLILSFLCPHIVAWSCPWSLEWPPSIYIRLQRPTSLSPRTSCSLFLFCECWYTWL